MFSIERRTKPMVRTVTLIFHTVVYQLVQCVLLRRGQIYDRAVAQYYFLYIMWLHKGDNLPLLWYLGNVNLIKFWKESKKSKDSKESVKCFVKFFVPIPIPWDWSYPGDAQVTLHTLQGHTPCPVHCIPFRRPPYSLERLPYDPETSGGHPTAREATLQPGDCPVSPAYPSFSQSIPKNVQHTQWCTKSLDCKTTRLSISTNQ